MFGSRTVAALLVFSPLLTPSPAFSAEQTQQHVATTATRVEHVVTPPGPLSQDRLQTAINATPEQAGTENTPVSEQPHIAQEIATTGSDVPPALTESLADLTSYLPYYWNYAIPIGTTQLAYDATHSYSGPYYSDQVLYFNWGSINNGGSTASGYTVHVEVSGTGGNTWNWTSITTSPGYWTHLTTDQGVGPLSAGTHTFRVWLDYTGVVSESSESNNYFERTITVSNRGQPELASFRPSNWDYAIPVGTTQLSWDSTHSNSGPYYNDQILYFNWGSINNGNATASGYTVHVEVTGTGGNTWNWTDISTSPAYWTHLTTDQTVGPLSAGTHTFRVWLDYYGAVGESDESNNYFERTITVSTRSQAELTSYRPSNWDYSIPIGTMQLAWDATHSNTGPYYSDQVLYFNWGSINNGNASASGYTVHVEVTGTGGNTWNWPDITTSPGYWTHVLTDQAVGPLSAGTHTFKVWLDYTGVVGESDETNNYFERTITVSTRSQAELASYRPSHWDYAVPIGTAQLSWDATHTNNGPYYNDQTLYFNWGAINNGTVAASGYTVRVEVTGTGGNSWNWPSVSTSPGYWSQLLTDQGVGPLATGSHTFKVWLDYTGVVGESDETNNYFERTITVSSRSSADIVVEPLQLSFTNNGSASAAASNTDPIEPGDRRILLQSGVIIPSENDPPRTLRQFVTSPHAVPRHALLQFASIPTEGDVALLADAGIRLLSYVPNNAYWVAVSPPAPAAALDNTSLTVTWSEDSSQAPKVSPVIAENRVPAHVRMLDGRLDVRIVFFEDIERDDADAKADTFAGLQVIEWVSDHTMRAFATPDTVQRFARTDIVEWIEPSPGPNAVTNAVASQRIHVDPIRAAPYSLNGSGVTVGVWDEGAVFAHSDFGTRMSVADGTTTVSNHSTHVAGTVGGSGAGDAAAMGMAPSVTIRSYNWDSDASEMRTGAGGQVRISNHSYGSVTGWYFNPTTSQWIDYGSTNFGLYDATASAWDDIVADTDLVIFKAAGNDRTDGPDYPTGPRMDGPYDTIATYGNAKNVITIGATTDADAMTSFSSWGPSNDGRVKPDLVANGDWLRSTWPNNSYNSIPGTSMATPSAAGGTALLYQYFQSLQGSNPTAATMKSLLIHAAQDRGRTGPDYEFGWGLINAQRSAELMTNGQWTTGSYATGTTRTFSIDVPSGTPTLKATLVWTDPAASPSVSVALQNDLDLLLRSPSGTVYRPWRLAGSNPSANATTGVNTVDNVEQVLVTSPAAGAWTIEVGGTVTIGSPQAFTLANEFLGHSFSIRNTGGADLSISSITPDQTAAWVSWAPQAPFTVTPGQSRSVTVSIDWSKAPTGQQSRRLLINSNVAAKSPYPNGVFVNTSLAAPSDTTGPNLNVTNPSDGQVVSTSPITVSGTASDSGRGDNGIRQVTINGSRASNDVATGSGTANWSKNISLALGGNTITVIATDNSSNQNTTTRTLSVTYQPPLTPPTNVIATASSSTSVAVTWTSSPSASTYQVYRSSNGLSWTPVGNPTAGTVFTDGTALADTAYLYKVRSRDLSANESSDSNRDLATTVIFSDPNLAASYVIKAAHLTQLRTAVNAVRTLAGMSPASFTDTTLDPTIFVKRLHVTELRAALDTARSPLALNPMSYTDPTITASSTPIKAIHIQDLRAGVR